MATIELAGVTRRFGALTAVDDIHLDVADGEIVGLLGHNGAGKTTLIRVINGLLEPDAGTVRVAGMDPVADGRAVRRATGVLTEYPALDQFLSARENLEVYAAINGVPHTLAAHRIDQLLHRLGLWERRDDVSRDLSAGLKQRVALARGLVHDPRILLLDEPTTNMDPVAARGVRQLIVESVRERGCTALLSTHNLTEAEELCDRIAILRHGQLLAVGSPAELRRRFGRVRGVRVGTTSGEVGRALAALDTAHAQAVDAETIEVSGEVAVPQVVARLVAAGVEVHRVEPLVPTLEDLYVALHGSAGPGDLRREPALGEPGAPEARR